MDPMAHRYNRRSQTYGRCWAPVLAPAALRLLDDVGADLDRDGARLLDVGTGTGTVAVAAVGRFPRLEVVGLDVSAGMLARAADAVALLEPVAAARLRFVEGAVETMVPALLDRASFDAAVSSFVLQLVPDRRRALAAIRDALRPGGILAFVTWADASKPDALEDAWDAALADGLRASGAAMPDLPEPPRAGPFGSAEAARAELAAAGYDGVEARGELLVHDLGRDGGRAMLVEYEQAAVLEAVEGRVRAAILARLDTRLAGLPDDAFVMRTPLVRASGRRPSR